MIAPSSKLPASRAYQSWKLVEGSWKLFAYFW
jgi:hypothetical protein